MSGLEQNCDIQTKMAEKSILSTTFQRAKTPSILDQSQQFLYQTDQQDLYFQNIFTWTFVPLIFYLKFECKVQMSKSKIRCETCMSQTGNPLILRHAMVFPQKVWCSREPANGSNVPLKLPIASVENVLFCREIARTLCAWECAGSEASQIWFCIPSFPPPFLAWHKRPKSTHVDSEEKGDSCCACRHARFSLFWSRRARASFARPTRSRNRWSCFQTHKDTTSETRTAVLSFEGEMHRTIEERVTRFLRLSWVLIKFQRTQSSETWLFTAGFFFVCGTHAQMNTCIRSYTPFIIPACSSCVFRVAVFTRRDTWIHCHLKTSMYSGEFHDHPSDHRNTFTWSVGCLRWARDVGVAVSNWTVSNWCWGNVELGYKNTHTQFSWPKIRK